MKSKASNILHILRSDSEVKSVLKKAKKIKTNYLLYKEELEKFIVGANNYARLIEDPEKEFERALSKLHRVQAYLDRMGTIRSDLLEKKRKLVELFQTASVLLGTFDIVQKAKSVSQREDLIDEIVLPISRKRDKVNDLLDTIESSTWNLKNTHSVISTQFEHAKQILYLKNPERYLKNDNRR